MKKIVFLIFFTMLICLEFSSCIQILPSDTTNNASSRSSVSENSSPHETVERLLPEIVLDTNFNSEYEARASEHADEAIKKAILTLYKNPVLQTSVKYSSYEEKPKEREGLSAKSQVLYDKLYLYISEMQDFRIKEEEYISYIYDEDGYRIPSMQELYIVLNVLLEDHSELSLYFYTVTEVDNAIRPIYINPGESPEREATDMKAVSDKVMLFDAVCNRIVGCMPDDISTYDRYRYLGIVITELCDYDRGLRTMGYPFQAYNCLINGYAVCEGYADAFEFLCQRANLWCYKIAGIHGTNEKTDKHGWNVINVDGELYYIDLTVADWSEPESEDWLSDFGINKAKADFGLYFPYDEYKKYKISEKSLNLK